MTEEHTTEEIESNEEAATDEVELPAPAPGIPAVYGAMSRILDGISAVTPDKTNKHLKYDYASSDLVFDVLRPMLAAEHVFMLPSSRFIERVGTVHQVDIEMRFICALDGSEIYVRWVGLGDDRGDKGVVKAITSGIRTALLKTFMIAVGTDPEGGNQVEGARPVPRHEGNSEADYISRIKELLRAAQVHERDIAVFVNDVVPPGLQAARSTCKAIEGEKDLARRKKRVTDKLKERKNKKR